MKYFIALFVIIGSLTMFARSETDSCTEEMQQSKNDSDFILEDKFYIPEADFNPGIWGHLKKRMLHHWQTLNRTVKSLITNRKKNEQNNKSYSNDVFGGHSQNRKIDVHTKNPSHRLPPSQPVSPITTGFSQKLQHPDYQFPLPSSPQPKIQKPPQTLIQPRKQVPPHPQMQPGVQFLPQTLSQSGVQKTQQRLTQPKIQPPPQTLLQPGIQAPPEIHDPLKRTSRSTTVQSHHRYSHKKNVDRALLLKLRTRPSQSKLKNQKPPRNQRPPEDQRPPRNQRPPEDQRPPRNQRPPEDQRPPRDQKPPRDKKSLEDQTTLENQKPARDQKLRDRKPPRNQRPPRNQWLRDRKPPRGPRF